MPNQPSRELEDRVKAILKKFGSGVTDNCLELINNPDFEFEKSHDKLFYKAKAAILDLVQGEVKAFNGRMLDDLQAYGAIMTDEAELLAWVDEQRQKLSQYLTKKDK